MKIKRIVAVIMAMVICLMSVPTTAFAADNESLKNTAVYINEDETPDPSPEPTEEPSPEPTEEPSPEPTEEPSPEPTEEPSPEPTEEPSPEPTEEPSPEPTEEPSPEPTEEPSPEPTEEPSPEPQPLTAPKVKAANDTATGKITLTWDAIEGAKEYKVFRSAKRNGSYSLMKTVRTGTEFTNLNAVPGKYYYYKVKAIAADSALNSEFSAIVGRTCDLAAPVITTGNEAATGKVTVSWSPVEGAAKYKVYRSTVKNGSYVLMKTVPGTEYTNANAVTGKLYYYKVKAIHSNTSANSAFSNTASRTCDLVQPVITLKNTSTSSIEISWKKVANATNYKVYRSTSKNGAYKPVTTTTSIRYNDTGLTLDKTYYYKVRAIHTNTNANSAYSKISSAKVLIMAPVLKKSATVTYNSIKIKWNKVPGADGYYIYRRVKTSDSWVKVATNTSETHTQFTDTDLTAGRYYYSVIAYDTVNGTEYTSVRSTGIRCRTLTKPKITVKAGDTNLVNTISWKKVTGATGYEVYCKVSDNNYWENYVTLDSSTLSYDHRVVTGKYYYYKVRAIYKYNGVISYGSFSAVSESMLWYNAPKLNYAMYGESQDGVAIAVIAIENKGNKPLQFFSDNGKWDDPYDSSYDCGLYLIDYNYAVNGYVRKLNSVEIPAGKTGYVTVLARTNDGRYVDGTTIHLRMLYGGAYFDTKINSTSFIWTVSEE